MLHSFNCSECKQTFSQVAKDRRSQCICVVGEIDIKAASILDKNKSIVSMVIHIEIKEFVKK